MLVQSLKIIIKKVIGYSLPKAELNNVSESYASQIL